MAKVESAESIAADANALFVDELFKEALEKYNEAILLDDKSSDLYTKRSVCNYKLERFTESMADAKKAIELDAKNAKGWFRKGLAAFSLGEFESAKQAFEKTQDLSPSQQNRTWIRKCEAEIADEGAEDDAESSEELEILKKNDAPPPLEPDVDPGRKAVAQNSQNQEKLPVQAVQSPPVMQTQPVPTQPAKPAVRHDWFQTETAVTVSVMIKGVKKEEASVQITAKTLGVSVKLPSGSEYQLNLDLADEVNPGESKYEVLGTKIEIKLKKARAVKWPTLEFTGSKIDSWNSVSDSKDKQPALYYPSSSKKGDKNWDKMASSVEDEKLEGEAALNQVFQNIYKGASDDQRRAMMKSFSQSGGTVLSTNWDEVGKGEVKGSPPAGMEMKKWNDLEH